MKNRRLVAVLAVAVLAVAFLSLAFTFARREQAPARSAVSPISTVFLIVLENVTWTEIVGNHSAPYINALLTRADVAYATNYNSPRGLHPSTPNYIWMEAGGNLDITNNAPPSTNHRSTRDHLVTYLNRAGYTWKAYFQNRAIDGAHCPMRDSYPYPDVPFALPFAFFDDVTGDRNPDDAYCASHLVSDASLDLDLATNSMANYNFVRVGDCLNMHDSCAPANNRIRQGDEWVSAVMPAILESRAYLGGGAVFLTWDEGTDDSDGPIGMIVLSQFVKRAGYHNAVYYTHSSLLKTVQEIFKVTPLLGDAGNPQTSDLSDLFRPGAIRQLAMPSGG